MRAWRRASYISRKRPVGNGGVALCGHNRGAAYTIGTILISASQDLADFLSLEDGRYGKGVINACRIKIIMQLEEIEAQLVKGILNLSDNEVTQITRSRRGEALLSIGNSRISLSIHSSTKEYEAISTAKADLVARMERG